MAQISSVMAIYSRNINDYSLPPNTQTMGIKLLVNLTECVVQNSDQNEGELHSLCFELI